MTMNTKTQLQLEPPSKATDADIQDRLRKIKARLAEQNQIIDMAIERKRNQDGKPTMELIVLVKPSADAEVEPHRLSQQGIAKLVLAAEAFGLTMDQLVDKANQDIAAAEYRVGINCDHCLTYHRP